MHFTANSRSQLALAACYWGFVFGPACAAAQPVGNISLQQSVINSTPSGGATLSDDAPGSLSNVVGTSATSVTVSTGNGSTFPLAGTLQHSSSHTGRNGRTTAGAAVELFPKPSAGMGLLTINFNLQAHGSGGETGIDDLTSELTGSQGYAEVFLEIVNGLNSQGNPDFLRNHHLFNSFPSGASATLSEAVTIPVKLNQPINIGIQAVSRITAAFGLTASASAQVNVSFSIVPMPFIWTGAEGSAYNHGPNWEGGAVPGASDSVQLANTVSNLLLDTARAQTGLSMPGGGIHTFILGGHVYGVGAEGVSLTGGRLTLSNGTLNAAGQNTRVGSAAGIPATLVVSQGGAGTTFNTGNLLVGHTGDGEVQIGNASVNVGTVLTMGATPNAKGTLRLDRGGLDVAGGAAIGIPPGSGSRIIAENESVLLWNDAATATFDHESRLEARGSGTFSLGGKFVFRGDSHLQVENKASFRTAVAADAFILDGGTATFSNEGKGLLGGVAVKNDGQLLLGDSALVEAESLTLSETGDSVVSVVGGVLDVKGGTLSIAAHPTSGKASLSVADGLLGILASKVEIGLGPGQGEIFISADGAIDLPDETLVSVGGNAPCSYKVVAGGLSVGGSFLFLEGSSLLVDGLGSQFLSTDIEIGGLGQGAVDEVKATFSSGSFNALGPAIFGNASISISGAAVVKATHLSLNGAMVSLGDNGSYLEVNKTTTVDAPSLFLSLGQGTIFEGGILALGDAASVIGKGTLAFDQVINNGGLISPGFSPGILTINGSLHQAAGRIVLEIGGGQPGVTHDQLVITGDFDFTGGVIELIFTEGFAPLAGQTFELIDISGESAGTPVVNVRGLEPGWDFEMERDPETGVLKVNSLSDGTALPPVRVSAFTVAVASGGGPGKQIIASVTGPPTAEVILEASNNLKQWRPVSTGAFNGAGSASFDVTDSDAAGDRQFYRFTLP